MVQLLLCIPLAWFMFHVMMPRVYRSKQAEVLPVALSTGKFDVLYFAAKHPKGVLVVATGDGGWSDQWEEPVAQRAAEAGYAVAGWDCREFADSRKFNQEQLAEAYHAAVEAVRKKAGLGAGTPVWYTGWSTGAEWSIAAAAYPKRHPDLKGILAVSPGERSRYGIDASDLLGVTPQGETSYALTEHADGLKGITLVQYAGEYDQLDDVEWLKSLKKQTPFRLVNMPEATHDMGGADERFMAEFFMGIQWIEDHQAAKW